MSKTIKVSAIIYNAKYDDLNPEPYFEELTTLPFKEWLKKRNEQRILEEGETHNETEEEFDVHTLEIEVNNEKNKTITLTDEEHNFLVEELGENRNRSQELLDDEIISIENDYLIKGIESNIEGYKREVRLCDSILKKL